jgi:hypothetical protein
MSESMNPRITDSFKNNTGKTLRKNRRKKFSYRNSRQVVLIDENTEAPNNSMENPTRPPAPQRRIWRRNQRRMPNQCPNAPHNTTSFLMNFHRQEYRGRTSLRDVIEDDEDSLTKGLYAFGSFVRHRKRTPGDMASVYSYSSYSSR